MAQRDYEAFWKDGYKISAGEWPVKGDIRKIIDGANKWELVKWQKFFWC